MKPIRYTIRVNNFCRDHSQLLLQTIRPFVEDMRSKIPEARLVFHPHWSNGPHILFGISAKQLTLDFADRLEGLLLQWADGQSPYPLDWQAFRKEEASLAGFEQLESTAVSSEPDLAVTRGDFTPGWPRGESALGVFRDCYRSDTISRTFQMIETNMSSPGEAVVQFALTLALLEHVSFAVEGNPWPLSPQGQANAAGHLFQGEKARRALDVVTEALRAAIANGAIDRSHDVRHVAILQRAHDEALDFGRRNLTLLMHWAEEEAPEGDARIVGLSRERWLEVATNPAHFAYRFTVNHIYDMQPQIGLTVLQRLIACTGLIRALETLRPDIMARSTKAGMRF